MADDLIEDINAAIGISEDYIIKSAEHVHWHRKIVSGLFEHDKQANSLKYHKDVHQRYASCLDRIHDMLLSSFINSYRTLHRSCTAFINAGGGNAHQKNVALSSETLRNHYGNIPLSKPNDIFRVPQDALAFLSTDTIVRRLETTLKGINNIRPDLDCIKLRIRGCSKDADKYKILIEQHVLDYGIDDYKLMYFHDDSFTVISLFLDLAKWGAIVDSLWVFLRGIGDEIISSTVTTRGGDVFRTQMYPLVQLDPTFHQILLPANHNIPANGGLT